jgi:type IV secretion system protein VirD4
MNTTTAWSMLQAAVVIFLVFVVIRAISIWFYRREMQALLDAAYVTSQTAHGTADWSRNAFPGVGPGSLFLGAVNGSAMYYDGDQHLITIAPTRTGKGTCHIIPNLLTYKGSMIVNDIKGENYELTEKKRREFGKVFCFAPFSETTDGFNPLDFVRRGTPAAFDDAMLLADMLIVSASSDDEGNHWKEAAKNLLAGLIGYVSETEVEGRRNMQRVRELLTLNQKAFMAFIQGAMADPSGPPYVVRAANMLLQKDIRERSGVVSTAQAQTSIWDSEPLARATQVSTFRIEELLDQVATLYIVVPPEHLSTYKSVLRVVLGLSLSIMTRKPPTRNENPIKAPPLTFLFDEFPSLGFMQPIVDAVAYLAGYGGRLWLFAQDLGQIREIYGDKTTSLQANCGARAFFGVADYDTAEYVSKMAGQKTVRTSSQSMKTSSIMFWDDIWQVGSQSLQYIGVPLITPDEVMRLPTWGEQQRQIIFLQGQAPVLALKIPYHVIDDWAAAAVRAPVSLPLDRPPMPPGSMPSNKPEPPSPRGRGAVAAVAKAKAHVATVAASSAHQDETIFLAAQNGTAYINEGNEGKGQGMTTDELIEETKVRAEQTHENMVNAASKLRMCEQELRQLEAEALTHEPGTPERQRLDFIIPHKRKVAENYRFIVEAGRTSLDAGKTVLNHLEGDE